MWNQVLTVYEEQHFCTLVLYTIKFSLIFSWRYGHLNLLKNPREFENIIKVHLFWIVKPFPENSNRFLFLFERKDLKITSAPILRNKSYKGKYFVKNASSWNKELPLFLWHRHLGNRLGIWFSEDFKGDQKLIKLVNLLKFA